MILDIRNRLLLMGMLPQKGNLPEMVDIYDLVRELKLSDEEKGQVNFVDGGEYIKWDYEKDPNKEISISNSQLDIIKKAINKLDSEGKISLEAIPLIKMING